MFVFILAKICKEKTSLSLLFYKHRFVDFMKIYLPTKANEFCTKANYRNSFVGNKREVSGVIFSYAENPDILIDSI